MKGRARVTGRVTVRVLDTRGEGAPCEGLPLYLGRFYEGIVLEAGLLAADAGLASPQFSGHIRVGAEGGPEAAGESAGPRAARVLDRGYPALQMSLQRFGGEPIATYAYRATFGAGPLNGGSDNEACLLSGEGPGALRLIYARIDPAVRVTAGDTLQVLWEITVRGRGKRGKGGE
jgi:hypothetical protein